MLINLWRSQKILLYPIVQIRLAICFLYILQILMEIRLQVCTAVVYYQMCQVRVEVQPNGATRNSNSISGSSQNRILLFQQNLLKGSLLFQTLHIYIYIYNSPIISVREFFYRFFLMDSILLKGDNPAPEQYKNIARVQN